MVGFFQKKKKSSKINKMNKHKRLSIGRVDDITGNIFWRYDAKGDPKFLSPDVFHEKRNKANERRRRNHAIKKSLNSVASAVEKNRSLTS